MVTHGGKNQMNNTKWFMQNGSLIRVPSKDALELLLENEAAAMRKDEREFEILLAISPLPIVAMPIIVDPVPGESLSSVMFKACKRMGLVGISEFQNKLKINDASILMPNQIKKVAHSLGTSPRALALTTPISIDRKSVFFYRHKLNLRHVTAHEGRICPSCIEQNGIGKAEWMLRAAIICPIHFAPLVTECQNCKASISSTRPEYGRCRCGVRYKTTGEPVSINSISLAALIVEKFHGRSTALYADALGLPQVAIESMPLSGLLDLVCLLGMAHRDPAKFQLRRLEWPVDIKSGINKFSLASDALKNWPSGLFPRLRSVRMYQPWEESSEQVTKTLDHILRTATHHMQEDGGRFLLGGIAEFTQRPHEWNAHRRRAADEVNNCLGS